MNHTVTTEAGEINLVEMWLRRDPTRLMAGAAAGLFAGVMGMVFAMIVAVVLGQEAWFPVKFGALPFLGGAATEFGFNLKSILLGILFHEFLGLVLGVVFAHFVYSNAMPALLAMGLVWGTFTWIFISNLFLRSFTDVLAVNLPSSVFFPVNLVFGLSMTSVAFFDRMLRGRR